jgi:hypothetical protein
MKKIISIVAFLLATSPICLFADNSNDAVLEVGIMGSSVTPPSQGQDIEMKVTILPDFGLSVDSTSFKFLPVKIMESSSAGLGVFVLSNKTTGWSLKVGAAPMQLQGGNVTDYLPATSVLYWSMGGFGTHYATANSRRMFAIDPMTFYDCAPSENSTAGTMVTLQVTVTPPGFTKAGDYRTTLKFILVDKI